MANLSNMRRKLHRLVEIAPEFVSHPGRLASVARGAHPASVVSLDQRWLRELNPNTIIDVGANIGQFAYAAHTIFPKAMIYAFEPLPNCFAQLCKRMEGISQFNAFEMAIGSENDRISILESDSSPSSSILAMTGAHTSAFPWTEKSVEVEVELRRLDSLQPNMNLVSPILLKIDVQGYSLEVLRGAVEILCKCELVIVEVSVVQLYHGESTFEEIDAFLRDRGFHFAGVLDQLRHPKTGEVLQMDAMYRTNR